MKYNIEVHNQLYVNQLFDILPKLDQVNSIDKSIIEDNDFFKINFSDTKGFKCPFSIWIEKVRGERFFFNIGERGKEATICHFVDITNETSIEEIKELLSSFFESDVIESQIYCQNKLKRIKYKILNERFSSDFSYLQESYFFCFQREVRKRQYQNWLTL